MSDLSARSRAIAAKQSLPESWLRGRQGEQRIAAWFEVNSALAALKPFMFDAKPANPAKEFENLLFWMAVLCSLWGEDIIDSATSAVDRREMAVRTLVPGTLPPVPNAATNDGTMRDPATGTGQNL